MVKLDPPDEIKQFIRSRLENVDQLRILLLLYKEQASPWEVLNLATQLYLSPGAVVAGIDRLQVNGLVAATGSDPPSYRYEAQTSELGNVVDQIVVLDRERPVTLLNLVYGRTGDIQAFTDAFRLRKKED